MLSPHNFDNTPTKLQAKHCHQQPTESDTTGSEQCQTSVAEQGIDVASYCQLSTHNSITCPVPTKQVHFPDGSDISVVHEMVAWNYAYRTARRGPWEQFARDRSHFRRRIDNLAPVLEPCLSRKVAKIHCI